LAGFFRIAAALASHCSFTAMKSRDGTTSGIVATSSQLPRSRSDE
jgi:hypothetical protein